MCMHALLFLLLMKLKGLRQWLLVVVIFKNFLRLLNGFMSPLNCNNNNNNEKRDSSTPFLIIIIGDSNSCSYLVHVALRDQPMRHD